MENARPAGVMTQPANLPILTIVTGGDQPYEAHPANGHVIIGREPPSDIVIHDQWISGTHLRIEPGHDEWTATDTSRNGVYLNGIREHTVTITDDLTLRLGHPEGTEVHFHLGDTDDPESSTTFYRTGETHDDSGEVDPHILVAGQAVAARRRQLNLSQRELARDKIINAGALISFEKGRTRPRRRTQEKLEEALGWPAGHIESLIYQSAAASLDDEEKTELIGGTTTVESKYMAEALKVALGMVKSSIAQLPPATTPEFNEQVTNIQAELRKLEGLAAKAASGAPEVIRVLSQARQAYRDLMIRAAKSPNATIGQRLFAGRQHAQLSVEEAASAVGLPVETINAAEAGIPLPGNATAAIEQLLDVLPSRSH